MRMDPPDGVIAQNSLLPILMSAPLATTTSCTQETAQRAAHALTTTLVTGIVGMLTSPVA